MDRGSGEEDPLSLALVLGKDREKPLEVLPMAKANFIKERRERLPQRERWAKPREALVQKCSCSRIVFKTDFM